jgi:outer membrane protein assembly factor BamB
MQRSLGWGVMGVSVMAAVAWGGALGLHGDGAGVFAGVSPVVSWDGKSKKNILWKTPMPGFSSSSPLAVKDKVFTTSDPYDLVCVDAKSGQVLWTKNNDQFEHMPADKAERGRALLAEERKAFEDLPVWASKVDDLMAKLAQSETNAARRKVWENVFVGRQEADESTFPQDAALKDLYVALAKEGRDRGFKRENVGNDLLREAHAPTQARTLELANEYAEWYEVRERGWHRVTGGCFASPVTDGENVYVSFANNVVACYGLDGTRRWSKWDHVPRAKPGRGVAGRRELYFAASLVLIGDLLIVAADQNRLRAYDAKTGDKKWESVYPFVGYSVGTPAHVKLQHLDVVVGANGRVYRVTDGKELLADLPPCDGGSSPLPNGDVVILQNGPQGKHAIKGLTAVRLTSLSADEVKWEKVWNRPACDTSRSPAIHEGLLYHQAVEGKSGWFEVCETATGEPVSDVKRPLKGGNISFSVAGGHVFAKDNDAKFWVFKTGRQPEQVASNALELGKGNGNYSLPGFAGGRIFVRSMDALYAIGTE